MVFLWLLSRGSVLALPAGLSCGRNVISVPRSPCSKCSRIYAETPTCARNLAWCWVGEGGRPPAQCPPVAAESHCVRSYATLGPWLKELPASEGRQTSNRDISTEGGHRDTPGRMFNLGSIRNISRESYCTNSSDTVFPKPRSERSQLRTLMPKKPARPIDSQDFRMALTSRGQLHPALQAGALQVSGPLQSPGPGPSKSGLPLPAGAAGS